VPDTVDLLTRRRLLEFGSAGYLGLNLGGLWRARAAAGPVESPRPVRACILVFLYGGPSHLDTFDPKPAGASSAPSRRRPPGCGCASTCRGWPG